MDFKEIINSDLILAIPSDSMGVAVELGWASALNKTIIFILNGEMFAFEKLYQVTECRFIYCTNDEASIPMLIRELNSFW